MKECKTVIGLALALLAAGCDVANLDETHGIEGDLDVPEVDQSVDSDFKCGSDLVTFSVASTVGGTGKGVRCVKFGTTHNYAGFSWYGEGFWGSSSYYRHIGEAHSTTTAKKLQGVAADIFGNGESYNSVTAEDGLTFVVDQWPNPNQITVTGAWGEKWTRVTTVSGYQAMGGKVATCGPNLRKFRAERTDGSFGGSGIRCMLKNHTTWYGEGSWRAGIGDIRTYAHLGTWGKSNYQFVSSHGASDICKSGTNVCAYYSLGTLTLTGTDYQLGNGLGTGYQVGGWNERWLPYSRRYSVRVDAVQVANDDGSYLTPITRDNVRAWIDRSNQVYQAADMEFLFINTAGTPDFRTLNNTVLNRMTGTGDANWNTAKTLGNQNSRPGKLTYYFRYGPDQATNKPTGGGFSWSDYNFVAMPGFLNTWLCNQQNIAILAHETGHYLGLSHTHRGDYQTVNEAQTAFINSFFQTSIFDGDGLTDTPPDPHIRDLDCNESNTSVTLSGVTFQLPRNNVMSYWYHSTAQTLTPQQVARVQLILGVRGL